MVLRLREKLLTDNYLHSDETPIQVMNEEGKKNTTKSDMWVYTTNSHSNNRLESLLTTLPKIPFQKDITLLDTLLSWNKKVQEICKTK